MIGELFLVAALSTGTVDPNTPVYAEKLHEIRQLSDCRAILYMYTIYTGIAYIVVHDLDERNEMLDHIKLSADDTFEVDAAIKNKQKILANDLLQIAPDDVILDAVVTRYVRKADELNERLNALTVDAAHDQVTFILNYTDTFNKCFNLLHE